MVGHVVNPEIADASYTVDTSSFSIDESNKLRSSVGSAINWTSPIGPVSFVISQNLSKANTDKTESFNFRLRTTF